MTIDPSKRGARRFVSKLILPFRIVIHAGKIVLHSDCKNAIVQFLYKSAGNIETFEIQSGLSANHNGFPSYHSNSL